ncbi:MAG: UDP-N-acetylmuramoyl-L-alanine--D-glutamate ligase [Burkholderiales bacterium]
MPLKDKNVLVLGLGDTGLSAVRWLERRGARVRVADSREAPPQLMRLRQEMPDVAVALGPFSAETFAAADLIVASPGVPLSEPRLAAARAGGVPVVGDVELFAQAIANGAAKVIAISGSNGKSTVTEMAGAMCRHAGLKTVVAGNIGLPVLDALLAAERDGEPEVYVLELSSFQLETTSSLNAAAATVLNVSEDHMDRYAGLADYAAAKARIFSGNGTQVLNRDDPHTLAMARPGRKQVSFGLDKPKSESEFGLRLHAGEPWLANGQECLLALRELPLTGMHNAANALAALALCRELEIEFGPLLAALRSFKGLPHRVEKVAEIGGVSYFDDSKGTNVGATAAALKGMTCPVVLIAGGEGKGQDFTPLRAAVAGKARAVVLIGCDGPAIAAALADCGVPVLAAADMEDAVRTAQQAAQAGDAVLLSPACASFDMFRNYAHRAEVFVAAVKQLEGCHA